MKKVNIYIGIICSLLLLTTASCDQENAGAIYNSENEGVTFLSKQSEILAQPSDATASYRIGRANVNGRLELPVTANYDTDIFTIPTSVVFEDGEGIATLSIPLEKAELGVTYSISLAFDSVKSSPFGYFKTTIAVKKDYIWIPAGVAEMYSSWAGNAEGIDVKIEYAQGTNPGRYRLVSPYYFLEPAYCPKPGFHLVFELDANHNASRFLEQQKIGETNATYGEIYFFSASQKDTFTNTGKEFTILGSFLVSAGSFGQMPEIFIWKEGYPGDAK